MLCWWSALSGKPPWSQSSVLMSEVQRNNLCHRRPSCFTFHSNACFTTDLACTPQNSSFVKALHSLSQVCLTILTHFHILYPLFVEVAVEVMETYNETSNMPKDASDCDSLSPSAQMHVSHGHCTTSIPNKIDAQSPITHNELKRYPLLNMC